MTPPFTAAPPRILARYLDDEPARGWDHTNIADERALTENMGHGWRIWREVALTHYERRPETCQKP